MSNTRKFYVAVDSDGDTREFTVDGDQKSEFDTSTELHTAVDLYQQAGRTMEYMPWTIIERTEEIVGSYRKPVAATFVRPDDVSFIEAE